MNKNLTEPQSLMTERQASAYLAVAVKTLQGWRWRGEGPRFLKLGRAVRYRRAELEAFIEDGLRISTSDRRTEQ